LDRGGPSVPGAQIVECRDQRAELGLVRVELDRSSSAAAASIG
jgi:hypothetical protein